ncbi:hypothetical protein GWI33_020030 [Rhynchophorus ferrugineus]|uniref:Uncharacterized protein n=1 Tax=Rhynchophorus ferrugineus TaxID=354439 RepID=A0A834M0V0_RHYFE|nr:hypothetical protein GWI33_020030 [Rhynchophorus ferrugineus]
MSKSDTMEEVLKEESRTTGELICRSTAKIPSVSFEARKVISNLKSGPDNWASINNLFGQSVPGSDGRRNMGQVDGVA